MPGRAGTQRFDPGDGDIGLVAGGFRQYLVSGRDVDRDAGTMGTRSMAHISVVVPLKRLRLLRCNNGYDQVEYGEANEPPGIPRDC